MSPTNHFIANRWIEGTGPSFEHVSPTSGRSAWRGSAATSVEIDLAVTAARIALPEWSSRPGDQRTKAVEQFAAAIKHRRDDLAGIICADTGKPRWEALTEVDAMANKVAISIEAQSHRRRTEERPDRGARSVIRFKPIGVAAVLGPFNLPGHLPNGHIIPALLAGNTVVFKPSEQAPRVGRAMAELWESVGLPGGVFNLVQGPRSTGEAIVGHPGVDAIFFTGSYGGGQAISRALLDHPEKMLALEMGGNNPLLVWESDGLDAAAYWTAISAFITAGQRCSCARRLIVTRDSAGDEFIERLQQLMPRLRVGHFSDEPEPFIGPVISGTAADAVLAAEAKLVEAGGRSIVPLKRLELGRAFLSPGLIDVTAVHHRLDAEIFGPLLQVIRVPNFDAAVREANATRFGLSAGIFTDRPELFDHFLAAARAGVVNWNRPLTGASSNAPFGGVGCSGNHRPSAYFAADYCSDPVASLESPTLEMPASLNPGIDP